MGRAALFVGGIVVLGWLALASLPAAGFPDPFGECLGPGCPEEPYDPPSNGEFTGTDEAVNVYVGGDMSVVGGAAESEGRLNVLGSLAVDRSSPGTYNIGIVGAGSRITPPSGQDHAVIGGGITVGAVSVIALGGSDLDETRWGNLVHGGPTDISPGDRLDLVPDGELVARDDTAELAPLRGVITDVSTCAATYPSTGTLDIEFGTATFTGDGVSDLQVFRVDGDLGSSTASLALAFEEIPPGATTVIDVTGEDPDLFVNSVLGGPASPRDSRLVWNVAAGEEVGFRGSAQLPGSILVGSPTSTTTITLPGTNGRVLLAGSLVHGGGGGGEELHAYPFNGTLPPCDGEDDDGIIDADGAGDDVDGPGDDTDGAGAGDDVDGSGDSDEVDGAGDDVDGPGDDADGAGAGGDDPGDDTEDAGYALLPETGGASTWILAAGLVALLCGVALLERRQR